MNKTILKYKNILKVKLLDFKIALFTWKNMKSLKSLAMFKELYTKELYGILCVDIIPWLC